MDMRGRLLVEAVVVGVGDGPFYYPACKQCYSKLIEPIAKEEPYSCYKCRKDFPKSAVNQRYRICLTISDEKSLANVTAFGNMLTPYFGCSAEDFHETWGKQLINFYYESESCIVKCALEKTLVGSSLLFGFKGIIKKAKGSRIFLQDITDLMKNSSIQYQGWKSDLIAVQIIPQNDSHYPIPVIRHLAKLNKANQDDEENFKSVTLNFESVLCDSIHQPVMRDVNHDDMSADSLHMEEKNCGNSSEFDMSSFLSTAGDDVSINFTMTDTTQKSGQSSGVFKNLKQVPSAVSRNASSRGREGKGGPVVDNGVTTSNTTPLSRSRSSWSIRRWQRNLKDENTPKSSRVLTRTLCTSPKSCKSSIIDFLDFSATPELPREKENCHPSGSVHNSLNNSTIAEMGWSPDEIGTNDRSVSCNSLSFYDIGNQYDWPVHNSMTRRENYPKHLTLKTSDNGIQNEDSVDISNIPTHQLNEKKRDILSLRGFSNNEKGGISKVIDCDNLDITDSMSGLSVIQDHCAPSTERPKVKGYDSTSTDTTRLQSSKLELGGRAVSLLAKQRKDLSVNITGKDRTLAVSEIYDNYTSTCQRDKSKVGGKNEVDNASLLDMPESEDFELFLACANIDQLMGDASKDVKLSNEKNQVEQTSNDINARSVIRTEGGCNSQSDGTGAVRDVTKDTNMDDVNTGDSQLYFDYEDSDLLLLACVDLELEKTLSVISNVNEQKRNINAQRGKSKNQGRNVDIEKIDYEKQDRLNMNQNNVSNSQLERDANDLALDLDNSANETSSMCAEKVTEKSRNVDESKCGTKGNVSVASMYVGGCGDSPFVEMPESEDFDLFLGNADLSIDGPVTVKELSYVRSESSEIEGNVKSTVDVTLSKEIEKRIASSKQLESCQVSFKDLATNFREVINDRFDHNHFKKGGKFRKQNDSLNCLSFSDNEVMTSSFSKEDDDSGRSRVSLLKCVSKASGKRHLELDEELDKLYHSQSQELYDTQYSPDNESDIFNVSCDLFNSTPQKSSTSNAMLINLQDYSSVFKQAKLNGSRSLFSSSSASSSPEIMKSYKTCRENNIVPGLSLPPPVKHSEEMSCLDASQADGSMDLFSQESDTSPPSRSKQTCDKNFVPLCLADNVSSYSPDLFSSQEEIEF